MTYDQNVGNKEARETALLSEAGSAAKSSTEGE
jgi:hypothetical protein